jgi:Adenylate cyclase, family 3 (some proteins contain HAMP domain)
MKTLSEITESIEKIFKTKWDTRDGLKVPEVTDVQLGNYSVELEGTVLYADLSDSTGLVSGYKSWFAAEVYKSYLVACCELIKNNEGTITAFDGDRVMAVYIGDSKNSNAARTALQINYLVNKVINPQIKKQYPDTPFVLKQSVGVDTSKLSVARTGVPWYNDLVWVGKSANYAAKMCGIRAGRYASFISASVFSKLNEITKYGGEPKALMWEKVNWEEMGFPIYQSAWEWRPD